MSNCIRRLSDDYQRINKGNIDPKRIFIEFDFLTKYDDDFQDSKENMDRKKLKAFKNFGKKHFKKTPSQKIEIMQKKIINKNLNQTWQNIFEKKKRFSGKQFINESKGNRFSFHDSYLTNFN